MYYNHIRTVLSVALLPPMAPLPSTCAIHTYTPHGFTAGVHTSNASSSGVLDGFEWEGVGGGEQQDETGGGGTSWGVRDGEDREVKLLGLKEQLEQTQLELQELKKGMHQQEMTAAAAASEAADAEVMRDIEQAHSYVIICIYACVCIYLCAHIFVCIYAQAAAAADAAAAAAAYIYIHTNICIQRYMYTHAYIHAII